MTNSLFQIKVLCFLFINIDNLFLANSKVIWKQLHQMALYGISCFCLCQQETHLHIFYLHFLSSIGWYTKALLPTVAISSLFFSWQELWIDGPSHSFSITYSCWLLNSVFQIMKHHHKTLMSIREEAEIKASMSRWCRGINQLIITKKWLTFSKFSSALLPVMMAVL